MNYVILAAGNGSRFMKEGVSTPKPMVEVCGCPMIVRLIEILMKNKAERINVVANSRMPALTGCLEKLKSEGVPLDIRPIVSENSFYSLEEACKGLTGRFIAMTVDTIFPTDEFKDYVKAVESMPDGEVLMGLTKYVDDESPLYALRESDGTIIDYKYGGEPYKNEVIVSAGVYGLTSEAIDEIKRLGKNPKSLSDFQHILASETDIKVASFEFSKAFDIDSSHDLASAETFIRETSEKKQAKNIFAKIRRDYKASLKSMDTEEHIDLAFYRPIGFVWACLFRKLGISPNAVTIASIFIGIGAGICFYPTKLWINIIGILLLIWANSFDSADGQLARLTGQYSPLGRILDGMAGDIWFITIYIAIVLRTVHTVDFFELHNWTIWVLALAAGMSHVVQAAVADRYRQLHLFFLKGAKSSELDSSVEVARRYLKLSWEKDFFNKIIQFLYFRYTVIQEKVTPQMVSLRLELKEKYAHRPIPEKLAQKFCERSLPLCKWENFMTFNWRTIFLFTGILCGYPWLYFVAELTIFNIVLIYTIHRHEAICKEIKENNLKVRNKNV